MKKTLKWISLILVLTLLMTFFAGCSRSGSTSNGSIVPGDESETDSFPDSGPDPDDDLKPQTISILAGENQPGEQEDYVADFVSVRQVDPGFSVSISAPSGYSEQDVLAGMVLKNLTNPTLTDPKEENLLAPDYLIAEGSGGSFTVTCVDGFNPGEVYQIALTDSSLSYSDEDESVRLYNITTAGETTQKMRIASGVRFISADELSSQDAETALRFDGVYRYDFENGARAANGGIGSFTYTQGSLNIGDIVAVYEGEKPEDRSVDETEQKIAYVKIKDIQSSGGGRSVYIYEGAEPEDVLFTPDIIPVNQECREKTDETGSITLPESDLTFTSDGTFSAMGLDENTTVEEGDYLAFYTGGIEDGSVTAYAEITSIIWTENPDGEDTAEIGYRVSELEDLLTCVDVYLEGTLSEEQIRLSYDEEAIREGVIEDLTNNGYLMESSYNLAQAALETEEARELLSGASLEDLTFYYGENEEIALSGKDYLAIANGQAVNSIDIKGDPDVVVTPNIVHFAGKTGYGMGLRLEAYSKFIITIRGSELAKAGLRITLTFFFETEVVMGYTFDATSIWKTWFIFPYLYDYNVSGSCANGIFVGVGFSAVATLFENKPEDPDAQNAGIPWPEKVDRTPGAEKIMTLANYIKEFGQKHESIFPPQTTGGGSLAEKYKAFIKTADKSWVDIINENIFDWNGAVDPLHIIAFRIKADFIVAGQLNAAIGVAVNYERSYRNTFSFMLFHKDDSTTQTDETDTSRFRADLYIFGAMGIRAGIRLTLAVGLFDARLDSIGVEVEGGVYQRLWGFFYAGIEINDVGRGSDKDMYYAGAFLAETGGYYSITFVAQAGDGAIAYKRYIDGGEYPFLKFGSEAVVNDFAYSEGDENENFSADFSDQSHTAIIPNSLFMMNAMNIKDGSVSSVSKSGSETKELFEISFDDPNLSYSYENGKHILTRADAPGGTGTATMTIRWKGDSFQALSNELIRHVQISWVANKRTIKFLNKDGSTFFMTTKPEGTPLTEEDWPAGEPTALGFEFTGWLDTDGSPLVKLPETMPTQNISYKSSWIGVPVSVNVRYYDCQYHDTSGRPVYELVDTDKIDGIFLNDESVSNVLPILEEHHLLRTLPDYDFEGKPPFVKKRVYERDSILRTDSVRFDGSTTFSLYMEWDTTTITYDNGDGTKTTKEYFPGAPIEFPQLTRQGYIFKGWVDENGNPVSGADAPVCIGDPATYTAVWEKIPPTLTVRCQVKVKNWGMTYMWSTVLTKEIVHDSYEITIREIVEGIEIDGYSFSDSSSAWSMEDTVSIAEDGTTAITLRYLAD